jgi:hypothetical protein
MGRPRAPGPEKEIVVDWILTNRAGVPDALLQFWPDLEHGPERKKVYQRVSNWLAEFKRERVKRPTASPTLGRRVVEPRPVVRTAEMEIDEPEEALPAPPLTMPEHILSEGKSVFLEWHLRILIGAMLDITNRRQWGLLSKASSSVSDVFRDLCHARTEEGSSGKMEATPAALAAVIKKEEARIKALLAAREQAANRKEREL